MKFSPLFIALLLLSHLSISLVSVTQARELPTLEQIQDAVNAFRNASGTPTPISLTGEDGCFPSTKDREKTVVCVVSTKIEGEEQRTSVPLSFERSWQIVEDREREIQARCPDRAQAQKLIRAVKGHTGIEVKKEDDPNGGTFTDERGFSRENKGPYRLMCRYFVDDFLGKDRLYITYIGTKAGEYFMDSDIEIWE
ncbi:MAG: hypothetical protein KDD64_00815 [Bdellovibrionales bacterium]|nr:hypothetical protein [Bdellovibrionales bacterium]